MSEAIKTKRPKAIRRSAESIKADRERAWHTLRGEGFNLYTMCLACGEVKSTRGKSRDSVRCFECFTTGSVGKKLLYDVLGNPRTETED